MVTVVADGQSQEFSTTAATVADALGEAGIPLGKLDRVAPSVKTPVTAGLKIRVTRVKRQVVTEEVTLPSETVVLADAEKPAGYTEVLEHGRDGRVRRVVAVWEKDGQITKRDVVKQTVLSKKRDTVMLRGTRGLSSRGDGWHSPRRMHATAYDPGPRSCGKWASGYTAIGVKAKKGVVAVDDRVIKMGTRMYIPGYGFAMAADRGSAIKGNRIDLCFETYAEAKRWGRRKIKVYILD